MMQICASYFFFKVLSENYAQQVSHNSIKDSHTTQMVAIQNHTLINWKSQELRNCNTFALCLNQTAQLEKKLLDTIKNDVLVINKHYLVYVDTYILVHWQLSKDF